MQGVGGLWLRLFTVGGFVMEVSCMELEVFGGGYMGLDDSGRQ